jgi:cytochrome b
MNLPVAAVRIWDLPTRVFHWLLAACVLGAVVSAKAGAMEWHFRLGYAVFALLVFRIVWGFVGGRWSRFACFVRGPGAVWRYARGRMPSDERPDVGHNPLGALSVLAMLAILAVQVGTGLVGDDDIANVGPLNRWVANATGLAATAWHKRWGQWLILGLVALHLVAIGVHAMRGQALVGAMLGGDKALPADTPASADTPATRGLALLLAAACAGLVAWVVLAGG